MQCAGGNVTVALAKNILGIHFQGCWTTSLNIFLVALDNVVISGVIFFNERWIKQRNINSTTGNLHSDENVQLLWRLLFDRPRHRKRIPQLHVTIRFTVYTVGYHAYARISPRWRKPSATTQQHDKSLRMYLDSFDDFPQRWSNGVPVNWCALFTLGHRLPWILS